MAPRGWWAATTKRDSLRCGENARHALHCDGVTTQPTRPAQSKTERKKALSSGASCMALPPVPLSISASIASTLSRLSATVGCAQRSHG